MVQLKAFWNRFKNIAILFSFVVNFTLVLVLLVVMLLLFQIKNGIAQPLINGLHSSFVGLDQAKIITTINVDDTINVKDTIPVKLDIPLNQETTVTLTKDVPLRLPASFTLRDGTTLNGIVNLALPKDLNLPVKLDLHVPVDSTLPIDIKVPISLKVPVNIPLDQTQLHDVANNLRLLFDPFVRLLGNLPNDWGGVWVLAGRILGGQAPNLMQSNGFIENPWPGFRTGLGTPPPAATSAPGVQGDTPAPDQGNGQTPVGPVGGGTPAPTAAAPTPVPPSATFVPLPTLPGAKSSSGGGANGGNPPANPTAKPPANPTAAPTKAGSAGDLGIISPTPKP